MELILNILNTCWLRHKWLNRNGRPTYIRSKDRGRAPGEVLFKTGDGWYRHERHCIRCGRREYLRQLDEHGQKAKWERI